MTLLHADVMIMILRLVDMQTLDSCRGVSARWMRLIDSTPLLWSNPVYDAESPAQDLVRQLPAYTKAQKWVHQQTVKRGPSDVMACEMLKKAQGSLVTLTFPSHMSSPAKVLNALYACPRPLLAGIVLGKDSTMKADLVFQVMHRCLPAMVTDIRFPYCSQIRDTEIRIVAEKCRTLRVLDISGCVNVSMKRLFITWNSVLVGRDASTGVEELYINDHPGIAEFLVYSTNSCHFSKLRVLHAAIRDQSVFARVSKLGPLLEYFKGIQITQAPFPDLRELNID
ncbi:hypothetical protein GGI21_006677, partial [Coemansia aciculifera]